MKSIHFNSKMTNPIKIIALVGACALAGHFGSNFNLDERVQSQVEKAYEQEAQKIRIALELNNDGKAINLGEAFSKTETFVPVNRVSADGLENKIGFSYNVEDTKHVKKVNIDSNLALFYDTFGTRYHFSIEKYSRDISEILSISYHNGGSIYGDGSVFMWDNNHDGKLDHINIIDKKNNTKISISRFKGKLEYGEVDEETAKKLYDLYSGIYHQFREQHDIPKRIKEFTPKFEIKETHIEGPFIQDPTESGDSLNIQN